MGPATSGSRFPRKLSSYKINYPPYFIAPRRVLGRGARRRERALSFLFLPLPVAAAPGRVSDELDSLKDRNEDRSVPIAAVPEPQFGERFAGKVTEDRKGGARPTFSNNE